MMRANRDIASVTMASQLLHYPQSLCTATIAVNGPKFGTFEIANKESV